MRGEQGGLAGKNRDAWLVVCVQTGEEVAVSVSAAGFVVVSERESLRLKEREGWAMGLLG